MSSAIRAIRVPYGPWLRRSVPPRPAPPCPAPPPEPTPATAPPPSPTGATSTGASTSHWAEIEGTRMNYVDIGSGEGPPIVFIHGLSGSWQNWLENLPYFAQKQRCIAMDLPGFGYSDMPREKISISGYARQVDALCEQLGLGAVHRRRQLDGRLRDRRARDPAPGARRARVPRRGGGNLDHEPAAAAASSRPPASSARSAPRPPHRTASSSRRPRPAVALHELRLPASDADRAGPDVRAAARRRQAGIRATRLDALTSYDFRDRLPEIEAPDADRLGRARHARPGRGRARVRAPDPAVAHRDPRGHRPRADDGAADASSTSCSRS